MKQLFFVIILIINFQLSTKADDISDIQIGGISIGESLLEYYSEEEIIKNSYKTKYPKK